VLACYCVLSRFIYVDPRFWELSGEIGSGVYIGSGGGVGSPGLGVGGLFFVLGFGILDSGHPALFVPFLLLPWAREMDRWGMHLEEFLSFGVYPLIA
jgi:hypothetical protein